MKAPTPTRPRPLHPDGIGDSVTIPTAEARASAEAGRIWNASLPAPDFGPIPTPRPRKEVTR